MQQRIVNVLREFTGEALGDDVRGIDGCSAPNWAIPVASLARAFAAFITAEGPGKAHRAASERIARAVWAAPDMVAGPGRLDTLVMSKVPGKVFMKTGAEGVYCGAFPDLGLGFALKIDDGTKRASEAVTRALLDRVLPATKGLGDSPILRNWVGTEVGEISDFWRSGAHARSAGGVSAVLKELSPVLVLPGMDGTGQLFRPFVERLSRRRNVEVAAYPPDLPLDYEGLTDLAAGRAPRQPYVVLGESFSGPIAIEIAARDRRVTGLALVASFARHPLPSWFEPPSRLIDAATARRADRGIAARLGPDAGGAGTPCAHPADHHACDDAGANLGRAPDRQARPPGGGALPDPVHRRNQGSAARQSRPA